jgi:hypothetical protein
VSDINASYSLGKICLGLMMLSYGCNSKPIDNTVLEGSDQIPEFSIFVEKEIKVENIFEINQIVPLEIDKENFLVDIYRLQVFEDNFFLLDRAFGTLLRFSGDGKSIAKIGEFGNGPEETPDIADFTLDGKEEELILLSIEERSISFFDLDGNFKRKIRLKNQSDMLSINQDRNIGMSITYFNEDYSNFELIDNSGKRIQTMFPFPQGVFPIGLKNISGHITRSHSGGFLYQEPANSVIFEIKGDEAYPKYQFESRDPMWPGEMKHQLNEYFQEVASGKISFPTRFFEESESHLFFGWNQRKRPSSQKVVDFRIGVFDKETKQSFITKECKLSGLMSGPMAVEGDCIYFIISMYHLMELSEEPIMEKHKHSMNQIQKSKGDMDTPVLVKMKLK